MALRFSTANLLLWNENAITLSQASSGSSYLVLSFEVIESVEFILETL